MRKVVQPNGITLVFDPELDNVYLRETKEDFVIDTFITKAHELTLTATEGGYYHEYRLGGGHRLVVDNPDKGVVTIATYKYDVMDVFLSIENGEVTRG